MTISVGQLVIHTERQKQTGVIYRDVSPKQRLTWQWKTTTPCALQGSDRSSSSCTTFPSFRGFPQQHSDWGSQAEWNLRRAEQRQCNAGHVSCTGSRWGTHIFASMFQDTQKQRQQKGHWCLTALPTSAQSLHWKETARCTPFVNPWQHLSAAQAFLGFEQSEQHDRCSLIHFGAPCLSLSL